MAKKKTPARAKKKPVAARATKKKPSATKATASSTTKTAKKRAASTRPAVAAKKKAASKATAPDKTATAKAPTKKVNAKKVTKKAAKKARAKKSAPPQVLITGDPLSPVLQFTPYDEGANEEFMNEPQTEHFRTILHSWKLLLMEEVDRTLSHMQDEAANFPDPNDRATQESEFTLELRTRDRERKLIRKIDEALVALDAGDYGFCEACGIEIGVRRLEARPTATLCIDCKVLEEIREKQMG